MKTIKIIIASVVIAVLTAGFMASPAGAASSAFASSALSSPLPPPTGKTCTARATVNIRSGPSTRNRMVGRLQRNNTFVVSAQKGRWVQGTSSKGNGWVMAALLRCPR